MSTRPRIGLAAVLICAGFAAVWFFLVAFSLLACDGDGGSSYAARASTVGRLCDAREGGPLLVVSTLGIGLAPVIVVTGAIVGTVRRAWRILAVCTVIGVVVLALVTLPFLALPRECSTEQRAAGADCESY